MQSLISKSILSMAIGEAMAVPLKNISRKELLKNPVIQMEEYKTFNLPKGTYSNATGMTLATIDSICSLQKIDYNDIASKLCDYYRELKYCTSSGVFDNDLTTRSALINFLNLKMDATKCGLNDKSNGCLLRILPIALYAYYKKLRNLDIFSIVKNTSYITHNDEEAIMGCYIYVKYIIFLLNKIDKKEAFRMLKSVDYSMYFSQKTIKRYDQVLNININNLGLSEIIADGTVLNTLKAFFWITINCDKYSSSIIGAINLGGDTPSVASLVGSAVGIIYADDLIPKNWLNDLRNYEYIYEFIDRFEEYLLS